MDCLTIDVGQTGIRILDSRGRVRHLPRASLHLNFPGAAQSLATALVDGIQGDEELTNANKPLRLAMSVTGFTRQGGRELLNRLSAVLPIERAVVVSDLIATHLTAHDQEFGVTLIAGTGLTALASSPHGVRVLGGTGWLLGDIGGGFWIGSSGLREALSFDDGTGGSRYLHEAALKSFGSIRDALAEMYAQPSPVKQVAEFAPLVAAGAHSGDAVSLRIWEQAVEESAKMIVSAVRDCGDAHPPATVVTGGLVREASLFQTPLKAILEPFTDVRFESGSVLPRCSSFLNLDSSSCFADFMVTHDSAA